MVMVLSSFSSSLQAKASPRAQSSLAFFPMSFSPSPTSNRFQFPLPRREALLLGCSITSSLFNIFVDSKFAKALEMDEPQEEEERVVRIFQEASPSVVYIKDLELQARSANDKENRNNGLVTLEEEEDFRDAKIEGTGSGFVWDKDGHIVTNYHVVSKLATDSTGLHRCRILFQDSNGRTLSSEGKLVGFDPAYDLAVLKVDIERSKLKPALIGASRDLRVGQNCFAIGNPYGYEHTLTTGVISGLQREIPSPNGRAIRGAIQTDAAINAGNSGGPLINSYGHVIGVNTATFTRKGSGISSGVNFAIPIDAVVHIVPSLIVFGTDLRDRY